MIICIGSVVDARSKILSSPLAKSFLESDSLALVSTAFLERICQHEQYVVDELLIEHERSWIGLDISDQFQISHIKDEFSPRRPLTLKLRVSLKNTETTTTNEKISTDSSSVENEDEPQGQCQWWRRQGCYPALKTRVNEKNIKFLESDNVDLETYDKIHSLCKELHTTTKVLLFDCLTLTLKNLDGFNGVKAGHVVDLQQLIESVRDCLWYIGPHQKKFTDRNCKIPKMFEAHMHFNKPSFSGHGLKVLRQETLQQHVDQISNHLEKSYINMNNCEVVKTACEQLVEALVKYIDYLEEKRISTQETQSDETSSNCQNCRIESLPIYTEDSAKHYTAQERDILFEISKLVDSTEDFYTAVHITELLPNVPHKRYKFLKKLRTHGFYNKNCVLFTACVSEPSGFVYHVWVEGDETDGDTLSCRQKTINDIQGNLPKFFSRAHKRRCQQLVNLLMVDKLQPAEFRALYKVLTGDESAGVNEASKNVEQRYMEILATSDPSIIRDYRIQNGSKSSFDPFWELCNDLIKQKTAVDDRRHDEVTTDGEVVTHMAIAISARDLYEQCCAAHREAGNDEQQIPSFSWFKFQFWPKSAFQKTALHYTGKLNVKFMIQQRQFRKFHPDQHYCNAIFCYCKAFSIQFKDFAAFVCTDDKHKVSVGEPDCPIAAVDRGKRVPVAHNTTFEVMDHDFSILSLTPTVILLNDIPETPNNSWYRGKPYIGLKLTATEPSSALRNAREVADCLIEQFGSLEQVPPVLVIYTDGGPEHRTNFLSVKIAMICLAKFLDLDCLIAARTAPGHSYLNPAEKVNCILNLGLYGIGVMRDRCSDQEFEMKLSRCSNLGDVRGLESKSTNFKEKVESTVQNTRDLLKATFSRLKLKDQMFSIFNPASENDIRSLFEAGELDCNPKDTMADLPRCPILKQVLSHCCKERTYHFSYKKCEKAGNGCKICKKSFRLPPEFISQVHHLPDPMPGEDKHFKPFDQVYGSTTSEEHMPSLKQKGQKGHGIPFTPLLQHVNNTRQFTRCSECDKPRLLYSKTKLSPLESKHLKRALNEKMYTCGTELVEFKESGVNTQSQYILDRVFVRQNVTCLTPVEAYYYSCGQWGDVCCHCGSSRKLTSPLNCFPICGTCTKNKKANILKQKRMAGNLPVMKNKTARK